MARRNLAGKRIIITGASSGIGRGVAEIAAARGAKLVLNGRSQDRLEETAAACRKAGAEVVLHVGDITDAAERERLIALAERNFGGLDILINNAGIGATGHFQEAKPDRLRTIMRVNLGQGYYFSRPLPAYELFSKNTRELPNQCQFVRLDLLPRREGHERPSAARGVAQPG